tara:strand:- start:338 stop:793 length:456 start_codon:yes stop_codon:yes gene_type:complete
MRLKNITILFFILIVGCGYQPIFSSKDVNFSIGKIEVKGNEKLNRILIKNLQNYKKISKGTKLYDLKIITEDKKIISSKNTKGDPKTFRIEIINELEVLNNNILISKKIFKENQNYNNKSSKFELNEYEEKTLNNLVEKISEDIIIFLQSL